MSDSGNTTGSQSANLTDLRNGTPEIWEELERTVLPKVRSALHRRIGPGAPSIDPDDAVQSAVRVLLRDLHDPQKQLPPTRRGLECWLVVTAWRKWRDQAERIRPQSLADGGSESAIGPPKDVRAGTPLDEVLGKETTERLAALYDRLNNQLDTRQREALTLWMEGKSERAIAGALGVTRARIESALDAAFAIGRRLWGEPGAA